MTWCNADIDLSLYIQRSSEELAEYINIKDSNGHVLDCSYVRRSDCHILLKEKIAQLQEAYDDIVRDLAEFKLHQKIRGES